MLFASDAIAAAPGVTPVGSGVTVNLIEINSAGDQVGGIIATTTTDGSGNYTLQAPAGFTPASNYVVQAGASYKLLAFVTGTTVNVDPYTHTTVLFITGVISDAGGNIAAVSTADVAAVMETVLGHSADVSSITAQGLVTALQGEVQNSTESSNIVASIASSGGITGAVTSTSGAVPNIQIAVRTYGNQVTQATTRTDATGKYTVHMPVGDYVVLALNDTTTSTAASQWWKSSGGTSNHHDAEKVTIGTTVVTKNFSLPAGGRISGNITASGSGLGGILVKLVDFTNSESLLWTMTQPEGTYCLNVAAGNYYLCAINSTQQPYATQIFNSTLTNGGKNKTEGQKLAITAGTSRTANMSLVTGHKIEGTVSDSGDNVAGVVVRFHDNIGPSPGTYVEGVRTRVDGRYRLWLLPGIYNVLTRGQTATVNVTTTDQTQSFSAAVGNITATLQDVSTNPVSEAIAFLYDNTGNLLGYEVSNASGSMMLYSNTPNNRVVFQMNNGQPIGSSVYDNSMQLMTGTTVTAPVSLGTVSLPAGAVLSGTVTTSGQPAANKYVQVRSGGKAGTNRFVTVRTMSDGSYTISLPENTIFDRVCAYDLGSSSTCPSTGSGSGSGTNYVFVDNVAMGAAGSTTTQDFAY